MHGLEPDLGEGVVASLGDAAALHIDDLTDPTAAARVVEAALAADPELRLERARLERAIGLVRELAVEEPALSEPRRVPAIYRRLASSTPISISPSSRRWRCCRWACTR